MMIDALSQLAAQRQAELDELITTWRANAGAAVRLWCGPGCGNCCALTVNCTFPEALALAGTIDGTQRQRLTDAVDCIINHAAQSADLRSFLSGYRRAVGPCPFLDDAANCSIYALRPLACRALLSTRRPDWCGVNLSDLAPIERDVFLASLDRSVVAFPTHYAAEPQALAGEVERGLILAMIRFAGFGVTGNLLLLVWLAGQPECAAALGSSAAFLAFAAERRIVPPFLLQLHLP